MRKVLLASTALMGLVALAQPAHAELKLNLGGYFSGYGVWSDNNETAGSSLRNFDIRRDTEVHVSGETTLDNGLTVGFHTEQALGGPTITDEAYAYFSGSWGRFNLGSEDGAAYLLQVAAPSADSNTDGLRTFIQALSPRTSQEQFRKIGTGVALTTVNLDFAEIGGAFGGGTTLDYDNGDFTNTDRLTYLTPKFNGFQAGISYAPEQGQNVVGNNVAAPSADNTAGGAFDSAGAAVTDGTNVIVSQYDNIWEASARWDGEFQGFGISVGGGYSSADLLANGPVAATGELAQTDGIQTWDAGLNLTWNGFSLGGDYTESNTETTGAVNDQGQNGTAILSGDVTRKTWDVGGAWDNGPYHLGVSYLDQETEFPTLSNLSGASNAADVSFIGDTNSVQKTTLGGGYTFGPGMTFRGSVAFGEFENETGGAANNDFTQVAVGTEIDF